MHLILCNFQQLWKMSLVPSHHSISALPLKIGVFCLGWVFLVVWFFVGFFFSHSDDVALESACLQSWTGKNNPTKKKSPKHLFSSGQLDESICFPGVLMQWVKETGLGRALSGIILKVMQLRLCLCYSMLQFTHSEMFRRDCFIFYYFANNSKKH